MVVSGGRSRLQRGVLRDNRISPACCSEVRAQLQSLDFTETHRHARHNYASIYQACSAHGFLQCGICRLESELRLIRSLLVVRRRCRLLSAQYWARLLKKVLGQYQYHPILASIGQYPNTGIVRTLAVRRWDSRRDGFAMPRQM